MTAENNLSENGMTRRQLIVTATVGGAALVAGAVGGTAVTSASRVGAELELIKLRALVALYEQLEKVGIDAIVSAGMNVVRGALDVVKGGVRLARDGITAVETALKNFQAMLDSLQGMADAANRGLNDLSQKFKAAESLVVTTLGNAAPLAEAIGNFFNSLLQKIPFGIGDDIQRALNALIDLIRAIPSTVDAMLNQLLQPLRAMFFPASGAPQVKSNLVDPITQNLLTPLKKFLTDTETLATSWDKDFVQPVQNALDERAKIRKQIVAMRNDIGLA